MKEDVRQAVEYELLLRSKISNSMLPVGIGLMVVIAGFLAMIPLDISDGAGVVYLYFIILIGASMDFYLKLFLLAGENKKSVNVYKKFRMIPVSQDFLIKGKVFLLTRFAIRCTIVYQLLHLGMRLIAGKKILCVEAFMVTIIMVVIYTFERIQLLMFARKLRR